MNEIHYTRRKLDSKYLDKFSNYKELSDNNRDVYLEEISDYLVNYLYKGNSSFQSEDIMGLFKLSKQELDVLKAAYFLRYKKVVELFENIPYLLRNLAHSTEREEVECRGIIRGSINWNKTFKIRYSEGYDDSSLFVCSPPLKHYNLDENKLLKFLLKTVVELFEDSLSFIKSNESDLDFSKLNDKNTSWYDTVSFIYQRSVVALRNVYFNNIDDIEFIHSDALNKAFNQRNPLYHDLAEVCELYEKLFVFDDFECLIDLIKKQILVVSDNNKLFEIYIFVHMINQLEKYGLKNSFEMGLFYEGHNNPVSAQFNDTIVKIYYQNVPQTFSDNSFYLKMTKNNEYDFNTAVRRPDLIVEIIKDGVSYFRIIEIKNSSKDEYMRNSFYKVLGYYTDFKGVNFTKNIPFVIVNWNGSKINELYEDEIFNRDIIIFNKNEFIDNIRILFSI